MATRYIFKEIRRKVLLMIKCKINIEENENCIKCCKYCNNRCEKNCIFVKRNMSCDNEISNKK
ncbi:hypothetical protein ACSW8T_15530 (plasmid) [Clostridium perfringens]